MNIETSILTKLLEAGVIARSFPFLRGVLKIGSLLPLGTVAGRREIDFLVGVEIKGLSGQDAFAIGVADHAHLEPRKHIAYLKLQIRLAVQCQCPIGAQCG